MKFKKFLSMALAAAMALSLTVPASAAKPAKNKNKTETPAVQAIAVDKIEDEDPRLPIVEGGAEINTANYPAIYIKQANDVAIIVHADDARSDADIIAEARASDKSLAKEGKGTTTVIRGTGEVWLHKNATTFVTVANGILTVNGPISHISFGGGKPAPEFPEDDGGEVSAVFQITKFLNDNKTFGEGFIFDIISVETRETVGTMTSDESGLAATTLSVVPGKYIIREQVDADKYMPVDDVYVTVDETGTAFDDTAFNGSITNVQWGKLEYTTPEVTEEYTEIWHELGYEKFTSVQTLVAMFPDESTPGVASSANGSAGNGFSWIGLNKTELENLPDGVNITISDKQKTIPDIAPKYPWEKPIAPIVNVKIDPVTKELVVTSTLQNFAVGAYNPGKVETRPGQMTVKPGGQYEATLSLDTITGDIFCLSFHVANKDGYEYKDATTAYHTGKTVERECKRPYTGEVTVTVTDEAGKTVTDLTKVAPGAYTVTVTANGQTLDTQTVTVNPGETTTVSFSGDLTVQGADEYHCANPDCDLNKSSAEG